MGEKNDGKWGAMADLDCAPMDLEEQEVHVPGTSLNVQVKQESSEYQTWSEIHQLCGSLAELCVAAKNGSTEAQKIEAMNLATSIQSKIPHSAPQLLMELMNAPAQAPQPQQQQVLIRQSAPFASCRELVEKFAEEKGAGKVMEGGKPSTACSFCGTQNSPEWRKGPSGPKTLCNACGLVYSKMIKARKIRKKL